MKMISPKFCANASMSLFTLTPKWLATIPAKKTKVTPSEMPNILILPRYTPTAETMASTIAVWMTDG